MLCSKSNWKSKDKLHGCWRARAPSSIRSWSLDYCIVEDSVLLVYAWLRWDVWPLVYIRIYGTPIPAITTWISDNLSMSKYKYEYVLQFSSGT
jgi:hypothetical protein